MRLKPGDAEGGVPGDGNPLESTAVLLAEVRKGSPGAKDRLVARYLPALRRWARGRLPSHARSLMETDDLVQVTLIRALDQIGTFEPRGEGAFLAYLVQILKNQIRDEIRWHGHRVSQEGLSQDPPDPEPSPLESLIGRQSLEMYELALQQLPAEHREAVILRIEMGFSHQEVARAIGSPSPNAARMLVSRALVTLAQKMNAAR